VVDSKGGMLGGKIIGRDPICQ